MARQLATFFLDGLYCGIDALQVQEIMRHQELTAVPLAPAVVRGLINLRGRIVTAIDLRRQIGLAERSGGDLPMHVVVRTADGPVSLLVDAIDDVVDVGDEGFEPAPESLKGRATDLVIGVHTLNDRLLLLLDVERAAQIEDRAAGAPA